MSGQVAFLGVSLVLQGITSPNLANGYIYIYISYIYIYYIYIIYCIYIVCNMYIKFGGLGLSFRSFQFINLLELHNNHYSMIPVIRFVEKGYLEVVNVNY